MECELESDALATEPLCHPKNNNHKHNRNNNTDNNKYNVYNAILTRLTALSIKKNRKSTRKLYMVGANLYAHEYKCW